MERAKTTALHGNAAAAKFNKLQSDFIKTVNRVKLEFIRIAAWLRMAWG